MTTLATLVVKLIGDTGEFSSSLDKAERTTKSFSASVTSSLGGMFSDVGRIAGGFVVGNLLSAGLSKIGDAFGDLKAAMIDGNAEFERYEVQFGVLLGSTEEAQKRLKELADFGAKTPFDLPEVVRADKILQSFGLHAEDVSKRFGKSGAQIRTIAGDVAAGTGASFEDIAGYLGKFSSGATGEAIARFQELGIVTRKELTEMGLRFSKSGELLSPLDESMTVLLKSMEGKFGGMMDAQSNTFEGMLSNMKDWIGQAGRVIGKPIFEKLKQGMKGLLDFLSSPAAQAALESLANGIAGFVQSAIDGIGKVIGWVQSNWPKIRNVIEPVINAIVGGLQQIFGWVNDNGPGIVQGLADGFQQAYNTIQPIITAIQTVVTTVFNIIRQFIYDHGEDIKNFVQSTWNTIAGIFDSLRQIVITIWEAIAKFISENQDGIRQVVEGVWLAIKLFVGTVLEAIRGVVNAVLALLNGDVEGAFNALKTAVENIWNGLKDTVAKAVESVRMLLLIAWAGIKQAAENVWNGIKRTIEGAWEGIKSGIFKALMAVKTWLETAWSNIVKGVESVWDGIRTFIENAWNNIINFFKSLPSKMFELGKQIIMGLWNGIKSMFENIGKGLSDFFNNTINDIKKKLGIQSPSKVFEGIGVNLMSGLAQGILRGADLPQLALDQVALKAVSGVSLQPAGAGSVSNVSNTTYNVTTDRTGIEVLLDRQRRAQQAAFERRM